MRLGILLYLGLEFQDFVVDLCLTFVNSRVFVSQTSTHETVPFLLNLPSALVRLALRLYQRNFKIGDVPFQRCNFVRESFDSFGVDWADVNKAAEICWINIPERLKARAGAGGIVLNWKSLRPYIERVARVLSVLVCHMGIPSCATRSASIRWPGFCVRACRY